MWELSRTRRGHDDGHRGREHNGHGTHLHQCHSQLRRRQPASVTSASAVLRHAGHGARVRRHRAPLHPRGGARVREHPSGSRDGREHGKPARGPLREHRTAAVPFGNGRKPGPEQLGYFRQTKGQPGFQQPGHLSSQPPAVSFSPSTSSSPSSPSSFFAEVLIEWSQWVSQSRILTLCRVYGHGCKLQAEAEGGPVVSVVTASA